MRRTDRWVERRGIFARGRGSLAHAYCTHYLPVLVPRYRYSKYSRPTAYCTVVPFGGSSGGARGGMYSEAHQPQQYSCATVYLVILYDVRCSIYYYLDSHSSHCSSMSVHIVTWPQRKVLVYSILAERHQHFDL